MWHTRCRLALRLFESVSLQTRQIVCVQNDDVADAVQSGRPVVALESTIITHGMPYPENISCANEVESLIRAQNVVPATIAILDGVIKVGLTSKEIEQLGNIEDSQAIKCSTRDLSFVVAKRLNAGTTVAATMAIAQRAGIQIFATGGIGGVHRRSMPHQCLDISTDLTELGKNNVAVVCSGAKSILDIEATLEYLETMGVFVARIDDSHCGQDQSFPAFYTASSAVKAPHIISSARQAADIIYCHRQVLKLRSGMLFAVPIPTQYSLDAAYVDGLVDLAMAEAQRLTVTGKDVTPFLLKYVVDHSNGRALASNMALIRNNATVAAQIAVRLSELQQCRCRIDPPKAKCRPWEQKKGDVMVPTSIAHPQPVVIGGSNLDITVKLGDASLPEGDVQMDGRMYQSSIDWSAGGVGRNITEALCKLNCSPSAFITAIGNDQAGEFLHAKMASVMAPHKIILANDDYTKSTTTKSSQCVVLLDKHGDCMFLAGDLNAHTAINSDLIKKHEYLIAEAPLIIVDGNLPVATLSTVFRLAIKHNVPVLYEPTDVATATKAYEAVHWKAITLITPNIGELKMIANYLKLKPHVTSNIDSIAFSAAQLSKCFSPVVIVTLGKNGVVVARRSGSDKDSLLPISQMDSAVHARHYKCDITPSDSIINASGAGDCFNAGFISAMLKGLPEAICISVGFEAAYKALQSHAPVPDAGIFDMSHSCWCKYAPYENISI